MVQKQELAAKMAVWRHKAIEGTLTLEEMKEAIAALREDRISACFASEASRNKAARNPVPTAEELLEKLDMFIGREKEVEVDETTIPDNHR